MIRVRNLEMSSSHCAICAPIVGNDVNSIIKQAELIKKSRADLAELRADFFEDYKDISLLCQMLYKLRGTLEDMPLLFTFRTGAEGGNAEISLEEYKALMTTVLRLDVTDIVDLELFTIKDRAEDLIELAHCNGVHVLLSNHDFEKTPDVEEIKSIFTEMHELHGDILKAAYMPRCEDDVENLRRAALITEAVKENVTIVAISMGEMGKRSRMEPEAFASSMTFGVAGKASAPGQIGVDELADIFSC